MNRTPSSILVREIVSEKHPPPPSTPIAFFRAATGQNIYVSQVVRLCLVGNLVIGQRPLDPTYYPLYDLEIEGPVVDARRTSRGVEFVVRNDWAGSPIKVALLRIPALRELPTSQGFVRALGEQLSKQVREGGVSWRYGLRTSVSLRDGLGLREDATKNQARRTKRARDPAGGVGPAGAANTVTRRTHAPFFPSPLRDGALPMIEE